MFVGQDIKKLLNHDDENESTTASEALDSALDINMMVAEMGENIQQFIAIGELIMAYESAKCQLQAENFDPKAFEEYKELFEDTQVSFGMESLDTYIHDKEFITLALEAAEGKQKELIDKQHEKIIEEAENTKSIMKSFTDIFNSKKKSAISVREKLDSITSIDKKILDSFNVQTLPEPARVLPPDVFAHNVKEAIKTIKNTKEFKRDEFANYTATVKDKFAKFEEPLFKKSVNLTDNAFHGWLTSWLAGGTIPNNIINLVLHIYIISKMRPVFDTSLLKTKDIPAKEKFKNDPIRTAKTLTDNAIRCFDQKIWVHGILDEIVSSFGMLAKNLFTGWSMNKLVYIAIVNYSFTILLVTRYAYLDGMSYYIKKGKTDIAAVEKLLRNR